MLQYSHYAIRSLVGKTECSTKSPLVSASEYFAQVIEGPTIPSQKAATKGFSFQGKKKDISTKA
jgi:hypothetical protein